MAARWSETPTLPSIPSKITSHPSWRPVSDPPCGELQAGGHVSQWEVRKEGDALGGPPHLGLICLTVGHHNL